jgi:hypothetical protein
MRAVFYHLHCTVRQPPTTSPFVGRTLYFLAPRIDHSLGALARPRTGAEAATPCVRSVLPIAGWRGNLPNERAKSPKSHPHSGAQCIADPLCRVRPTTLQAKTVTCRAKKGRGAPASPLLRVRRANSVVSQSPRIVSGRVLPAPQSDVGQNAGAQEQRGYGYRAAFETSAHRPKHKVSFPLLPSQLLTVHCEPAARKALRWLRINCSKGQMGRGRRLDRVCHSSSSVPCTS